MSVRVRIVVVLAIAAAGIVAGGVRGFIDALINVDSG